MSDSDPQRWQRVKEIFQGALERKGAEREAFLAECCDDQDLRAVHAGLAQPLRQPRAVAVDDDPGQDLRAGDDDARARAHDTHVGRTSALSTRGRLPGRSS